MFETAMFLDAMEKLCKKAHQNSKDKGFWDGVENKSVPTKLALIHSEVSEWLEAYRVGIKPTTKTYPSPVDGTPIVLGMIDSGVVRPLTNEEEEAADILLRLADLCEARNIDLGRVTLAKMQYNASRPHMHGGKKV